MKGKRERRWICGILIVCLTMNVLQALNSGNNTSKAAEGATSFEELKEALESGETEEIHLDKDILIEREIQVRGKKRINGNGHVLKRMSGEKDSYGGTLFYVKNAELKLQNIEMHGGGSSAVIQKNIYGRLIEVQSGEVVLYSGTVLCANQNIKQNNDGGGAVLIKNNGVLTLEGGIIKNNQNVTKGAGVCVEKGGRFVMNSGEIIGNKTVGIGPVQGFDGRGGGIYSQGTVKIAGGKIRGNSAKGFVEGGVRYGGAGGAIYAGGKSELLITGGTISGNVTENGEDVYQVGGTKKKKSQKTTSPKPTAKSKVSAKKKNKTSVPLTVTPSIAPTVTPTGKPKRAPEASERQSPAPTKERDKPVLLTAPRWFFQREIRNYSKEQWKSELFQGCKLDCGDYTIQENSIEWKWNGLLSNCTGKYLVELSWGNILSATISVNIIDEVIEENIEENEEKTVRFCQPEEVGRPEEVWVFTAGDLLEIKEYMRGRENPFSRETNQSFLALFHGCRGEMEEYVGERK